MLELLSATFDLKTQQKMNQRVRPQGLLEILNIGKHRSGEALNVSLSKEYVRLARFQTSWTEKLLWFIKSLQHGSTFMI